MNNNDQHSISVLIIEDNLGDYILVEDYLLETFKHVNIKHCSDYKDAVDYLQNKETNISIILLDLHLPDLNGIDLIQQILLKSSQTPVIILTGYSDLTIAQKSLQMGVYDFLIKDEMNPTLLNKSIEFAINRRSYIKQLEDERLNYENLFNLSPQPMWLLELDTLNILNANFSAVTKYGYSLNKLKNMSFLELHPKEENEVIKQKISDNQELCENEHFLHFLKDGTEIKVDIFCKEVQDTSSSKCVIVQASDVTETLNHIDTIEVQNKKLKNIAWTQSHVVRAPLSRILGIIELIEDQKDSLDDVSFWLKQLKVSTHEMDEVVKNITKEAQ